MVNDRREEATGACGLGQHDGPPVGEVPPPPVTGPPEPLLQGLDGVDWAGARALKPPRPLTAAISAITSNGSRLLMGPAVPPPA
jgi:hypothetical protein